MTTATIDDLKSLISTVQTDAELSSIVSISNDILSGMGISDTNARYKELHLYKSAVICLQRMQTNGELPYMSKLGSVQEMNSDIIKSIKMYQDLFDSVLKSVQVSLNLSSTYVISHHRGDMYYER